MMPNTNRNQITERFLDLTLEVNYLLTGENYIVVKRPAESILQSNSPCVLDGSNRIQSPSTVPPPHSLMHDGNNEQKIMKLTNKIIHLLTGEVWKYLEGHKEPYNDLMMDTHQPLSSLDGSLNSSETDDLPIQVPSANCVTVGEVSVNHGENSMTFNELNKTPSKSVGPEISLHEERNLPIGEIYSLKECSQTKSPTAFNVEEPVPQEDINLTDNDIITPTEQTQYPSTHIKEDPALCEEGNLIDTDIITPTEKTEYPSIHIKEEPASYDDETLTDADIIRPTVQTEYQFINIKEEPASCDEENLTETNIHTNITHTEYPSTYIKEESPWCEEGYLTDNDIYTSTEQTQTECESTHITEDSASCEEGNFTDTDIYANTEHIQTECPSTPITDDSASCEEVDISDLDIQTLPCDPMIEYERNTNSSDSHEVSLTNLNQMKATCSECEENITCKTNLIGHKGFESKSHVIEFHKTCQGAESHPLIKQEKQETKSHPRCRLIHSGEKHKRKHSCSECEKCFKCISTLKLHLRSHTGEKPFSCSECGKCLSQKKSPIAQEWIQSEKKPFACSECGKCFSQSGSFNRHLRIHTGLKPFSCSECGKSFSQKSNLDRHAMIHTGLKPFSCTECGKCFSQKGHFNTHLRVHNGNKPEIKKL
ncbi:oocyte zinc finger -like [Pelobates cultripes]|uniref:Oocyte zinc finger -like n=2 Tax=Pelobates cultripes TaxID=61616 RepID=A0AAD1T812_PELCU|nr:oocyte zinc finger -like [Pelobates cultripes]